MSLSRITSPSTRTHVLEIAGNAIVGGMESSVLRLVSHLPRERFTITAVCPFDGRFAERLRASGVEVVIMAMPDEEPSWTSVQLVRALVLTRQIQVIHAHLGNAHLLAGLAGRLTGRPVLATIHGRKATLLDFEVQRTTGSHLHLVSRQAELHAMGLGVDGYFLHHIENGVDLKTFRPRDAADAPLRKRLGIPAEAPLAGFVGRLSWEKAPDLFVAAAAFMGPRNPDAHFVLVGDGPMSPALLAQIERLGLSGRVHLAGLEEDVARVYPQVDVLICPSRSEAMPLVILEAMASGRPVIATQVGSVPDLVREGATGYLVPPEDPRVIAERLTSILSDRPLRVRMGAAARQLAIDRFSIDVSLDSMGHLLTQLARGSDATAAPLESPETQRTAT